MLKVWNLGLLATSTLSPLITQRNFLLLQNANVLIQEQEYFSTF
jgi:hypothetical protein